MDEERQATATKTETVTVTKRYGTPQISISGQSPERRALVVFPYDGGSDEVAIPPEEFDAFYASWQTDADLMRLVEPDEVAIDGDLLNGEPSPEA